MPTTTDKTENKPNGSETKALLQIAAPSLPILLKRLDLKDHTLSDPFLPREPQQIEPTHWAEIPILPGEIEIQRLEQQTAKARGRSES